VHGRLTDASNATLYSTATLDGTAIGCVYKPVAGEKPLWDFPARTLARREVAAYELSAASGLSVVPPTVLRDGPFGLGSVQWWVTGGSDSGPGFGFGTGSGPGAGSVAGDGPVGLGGMPGAAEPVMGELGAGVVDVVPPNRMPPGWLHVLDAEGRVARFAQDVKACALGQAAAGVVGQAVIGASADELLTARDAMLAMLKSGGEGPDGRFEGLRVLKQVADYPARHASTMVGLEATLDAVSQALAARTALAGAA
jgi:hypothetical protein